MTDTGTVGYTVIGTGATLMHVSAGVLLIRAGSDPHFANVGAFCSLSASVLLDTISTVSEATNDR